MSQGNHACQSCASVSSSALGCRPLRDPLTCVENLQLSVAAIDEPLGDWAAQILFVVELHPTADLGDITARARDQVSGPLGVIPGRN